MERNNDFALITGASLGIGKAIALELSSRNINTLLVALDTPELEETKLLVDEKYDTKVDAFGVDLTDPSAAKQIYDWCDSNGYNVTILINNAGFGDSGYFENIPIEKYCKMIDLNNKAYISLTYQFLPNMKKNGAGYIMNTSSMEATIPLPYKAVYTGTKNFIYYFSLALSEEVRRSGIKVMVLCPGSVLTNEEGLKRIEVQGAKARLMVMMPEDVARIAVKNMFQGMLVSNPGKINWWVTKIIKLVPTRLKMRILEKIFSAYT